MSEIQQIVDGLNGEPFKLGLSLVTFHEKTPVELAQVLNDVLGYLDEAHRGDVRDIPAEVLAPRMIRFLQLLKAPVVGDPDEFGLKLVGGDRTAVYSVLFYLLSRLDMLKKRAYLGRYLAKVDVPPEFLMDETAQDLMQQLVALQAEFKETHRAVEQLRSNKLNVAELRLEISQLEEEKTQLTERIAQLKRRNEGTPGFMQLLEATSALRKEQEEESKLQERLMEQRQSLALAERRYGETSRRLVEARASTNEEMTGDALLELTRREHEENRRLLAGPLPQAIESRREALVKMQRTLMEPTKTEDDAVALRRQVRELEDTVRRLTSEVAAAQRAAGDDKLAMFRRQSAMVVKALADKEETAERLRRELETTSREIESKEAKLSEISGPKYMRREDFKAYAAVLRSKTNTFKALKGEIAEIQRETVVLARTEQILKSRASDMDDFLRKLEERRGVAGYLGVQRELEQVSALKAQVDLTKGKTLAEISRIVTDINSTLKEKKTRLAPQIKRLRQVRFDFTELETQYMQAKGRYDTMAAGLDAQRTDRERECDALQAEALALERQFHTVHGQIALVRERLARAEEERGFQSGSGRLLRDFATWKDLYTQKLAQQEQLAKQLRLQQRDLKEHAGEFSLQRGYFSDLRTLLDWKLRAYTDGRAGGPATGGGAALGSMSAGGGAVRDGWAIIQCNRVGEKKWEGSGEEEREKRKK